MDAVLKAYRIWYLNLWLFICSSQFLYPILPLTRGVFLRKPVDISQCSRRCSLPINSFPWKNPPLLPAHPVQGGSMSGNPQGFYNEAAPAYPVQGGIFSRGIFSRKSVDTVSQPSLLCSTRRQFFPIQIFGTKKSKFSQKIKFKKSSLGDKLESAILARNSKKQKSCI